MAMAEGQTIVPPPGDYKYVSLVLEKAGATYTPTWGVGAAVHQGDVYLRASTRDGKIRIPGRLSVRQIVSELTLDGSTIRGVFLY
jgi:hypothetical protein